MPRLFWKIFGWFWGAMVLIGLAMFTVVLTTRPDPMPQSWRQNTASALHATAAVAVSEWERGDAPALRNALRNASRENDARLRLLNSWGERLTPNRARDAPNATAPQNDRPTAGNTPIAEGNRRDFEKRESDNSVGRARFNDDQAGTQLRARFRALIARAAQSEAPQFELLGERAVVALRETSESGRKYLLIADLPRPQSGRPAAAARTQLIGGLVALALSGLVCWGLVRYLTAPLFALRGATRQFAAGDLSARTGANRSGRRDEVADLGRDFDAMAARIENLIEGQRQLLGDISHELRSPLARLRLANALGARHIESGAQGAQFAPAFERISRETARLDALIGQLLDLTRLENGGQNARESVDLSALLNEIVADARFEAQAHNKRVEVARADAVCLRGERALLGSAIENVIRNALRHTPESTAVEIALESGANAATIRVRDRGAGVPDELLARLWEPFFRVEQARDRQSGGAGLGLAIVQRAIQAHGGNVEARNAPDGGLEVEMRLPLDVARSNSKC